MKTQLSKKKKKIFFFKNISPFLSGFTTEEKKIPVDCYMKFLSSIKN